MPATATVRPEAQDLPTRLINLVTGTVELVLFAILAAWPLAWLWDNVLVGPISIVGPIGDDFWPAVVFVLALVGVLRLFGFAVVKNDGFDLGVSGVVDAVLRAVYVALPIWAVFVAAWLVREYLV
jgi:hypothetical protein